MPEIYLYPSAVLAYLVLLVYQFQKVQDRYLWAAFNLTKDK